MAGNFQRFYPQFPTGIGKKGNKKKSRIKWSWTEPPGKIWSACDWYLGFRYMEKEWFGFGFSVLVWFDNTISRDLNHIKICPWFILVYRGSYHTQAVFDNQKSGNGFSRNDCFVSNLWWPFPFWKNWLNHGAFLQQGFLNTSKPLATFNISFRENPANFDLRWLRAMAFLNGFYNRWWWRDEKES